MAEKDSAYLELRRPVLPDESSRFDVPPEVVTSIPNVDHRYGDGRAEILGIAVYDADGRPAHLLNPGSRVAVRITAKANEVLLHPNLGFMLRNHLGIDFAGTNTLREGIELEPMRPGETITVDFHLELPLLYPAHFSFSPAIADGTLLRYKMCDWIDNAIAIQMGHTDGPIYGYLHLPCRVSVNSRMAIRSESEVESSLA